MRGVEEKGRLHGRMHGGLSVKEKIRFTKTMAFNLALLVSVSLIVFCAVTLFLQARRSRAMYSYEATDRKVKIAVALQQTLKDFAVSGDVQAMEPVLTDFMARNHDIAQLCVTGPQGVLITSASPRRCPEISKKTKKSFLKSFSTKTRRIERIAPSSTIPTGLLEVRIPLSPGNEKYGETILWFYDLDAVGDERLRKIVDLEGYIAANVKSLLSLFRYEEIDRLAAYLTREDTNIRYVIVTDGALRVISHTDAKMKFKRLKDPESMAAEKTGPYHPIVIQSIGKGANEIMDVAMGLFDGAKRVGGIRIGYSLRSQYIHNLHSGMSIAAAIAVLIGAVLLISVVLGHRISAPVRELSSAALRIGKGDLEAKTKYKTGGDEIRMLCDSFNLMVAGLKERDFVKDTFSRYVTKQVAEEILKDPSRVTTGGKKQEVTVLFSDIRGFTTYSENHTPEEVVFHLNEYLSEMVDVIFKFEGTLDKYIGDAIMAVFGSPLTHPDDPMRAVKTALEMQDRLNKLNDKWKEEGREALKIGIGINTGEVIVGNIGDVRRMEYTVIGDNVNLASRIEGLTKNFNCPIIISQSTYGKVRDRVIVRALDTVVVKGKEQAVDIYELIGLRD